jgi:hypothetical protein
MSAHGETIPAKQPDPAASPKPTGTARFLHGLNPDNAQVAAALKACDSKLPTTTAGFLGLRRLRTALLNAP